MPLCCKLRQLSICLASRWQWQMMCLCSRLLAVMCVYCKQSQVQATENIDYWTKCQHCQAGCRGTCSYRDPKQFNDYQAHAVCQRREWCVLYSLFTWYFGIQMYRVLSSVNSANGWKKTNESTPFPTHVNQGKKFSNIFNISTFWDNMSKYNKYIS